MADDWEWLKEPTTWESVASLIGRKDYEFDFGDESERLDAVQIVCEALYKDVHGSSNDREWTPQTPRPNG